MLSCQVISQESLLSVQRNELEIIGQMRKFLKYFVILKDEICLKHLLLKQAKHYAWLKKALKHSTCRVSY